MEHNVLENLPYFFILSLMTSPLLAKEGTLIVLYGTQCAGKSTLSKQLIQTLPGNIEVVKRTPIVVEYRKEIAKCSDPSQAWGLIKYGYVIA